MLCVKDLAKQILSSVVILGIHLKHFLKLSIYPVGDIHLHLAHKDKKWTFISVDIEQRLWKQETCSTGKVCVLKCGIETATVLIDRAEGNHLK